MIDYRLALDDGSWTNNAYTRTAKKNGIPSAFIVGKDGIVEWIGHPGSIDQPLQIPIDSHTQQECGKHTLCREVSPRTDFTAFFILRGA